jgi:hypothetical protein
LVNVRLVATGLGEELELGFLEGLSSEIFNFVFFFYFINLEVDEILSR